jgi:hypothetical protein
MRAGPRPYFFRTDERVIASGWRRNNMECVHSLAGGILLVGGGTGKEPFCSFYARRGLCLPREVAWRRVTYPVTMGPRSFTEALST